MKLFKSISLMACILAFSGSQAFAHPETQTDEEPLCGAYTPQGSNSGLVLYWNDPNISADLYWNTFDCWNNYIDQPRDEECNMDTYAHEYCTDTSNFSYDWYNPYYPAEIYWFTQDCSKGPC